jgi:hypothetical protein
MSDDKRRCIQCNALIRHEAHPWILFLNARAKLIQSFHDEGKDDVEIAQIVSADPEQITLIRLSTK